MDNLTRLCTNIKKLDRIKILQKVYNKTFEKYALDLNRIDQLYNQGIDAEGNSLGSYAASTVVRKRSKGQPTDRITLKDTGEFYSTFEFDIKVGSDIEFQIVADDMQKRLFERYGEIVGWTKENTDELKTHIQEAFFVEVEKQIWKGL